MTLFSIFFLLFFTVLCCSYFYQKFDKYVPTLMYHRIADIPGDRNALSPDKFKEQLDYLKENNFTTVTAQMVYDYYHGGTPLPPKPVLLTFDDGYADNLTAALPLLTERNMTATVFPISDWVGKENRWEDFHKAITTTMDWNELKRWQIAGLEIASHTVSHPFLSRCQNTALTEELCASKRCLEEKLGTPIHFLCYPYGDFAEATVQAAQNAGYLAAFAIFENAPLWKLHLHALPRIPIPSGQKMWEFKLKVSKLHVLFIALRQWERNGKRYLRKRTQKAKGAAS